MRRAGPLAAALLLSAAGPSPAPSSSPGSLPVIVSSKMDTEGSVIGAMIIETLRAHGVEVRDRLELGPTSLVREALRAGQIDVYPEYTGNGAIFFHREGDPAFRDARAGWALDRALDAANAIVWLPPAPADNTWAIAVTRGLAARAHLADLGDFARLAGSGTHLRLAASSEFVESPAALPAFERVYGFHLTEAQLLVLSGGDTAATERAAAEGISGVDATMAYATDGALALLPLVLLADPRHAQTVYAPCAVIRREVLDAHPGIAGWLAPVFAALTRPTLQRLNARVAAEGVPAGAVAHDFLAHLPAG